MPTYFSGSLHSYYTSPRILKAGLESVLSGGRISDLKCPVFFPYNPLLQQLFGWLYRQYVGLDDRAAQILEENASKIFWAILKADREVMDRRIFIEPDEIEWKESNETIRQGQRLTIVEGTVQDFDDVAHPDITPFRLLCDGDHISLIQLYNDLRVGVEREQCEMKVWWNELKNACLGAYIDAENRAGRVADLSEFDLNSMCVEGIDFSGTRLKATQFGRLVLTRREFNFRGVQLTDRDGTAGLGDLYFIHCMLDKPLALQLIARGADSRMVFMQYLKTEQMLGHTGITLSGFDIASLRLNHDDRLFLEKFRVVPD